ncbi:hypothetical protein EHO58_07145 [Leptospira selangorensis]|uniref:hypothetical protein n=1 Tax=Leptospira selangorensis TaxID=2484982 RepID=UPI0010829F9E|nr:hypothetical protein [Leptospira selangorensis]TGK08364.1 hypothetical protein EHO58_07145 [Leptospira selangorensis]
MNRIIKEKYSSRPYSSKIVLLCANLLFLFSCYGPGVSKRYVCDSEKIHSDSQFICSLYLVSDEPTEEQNRQFSECIILATTYDDQKCDKESDWEPWWL